MDQDWNVDCSMKYSTYLALNSLHPFYTLSPFHMPTDLKTQLERLTIFPNVNYFTQHIKLFSKMTTESSNSSTLDNRKGKIDVDVFNNTQSAVHRYKNSSYTLTY